MIEALGLSRTYAGRRAVDGVTLRVAPSSVHGLVGPNGAGKSTLIGMLLGLVRPDAGTVRLLGRDVTGTGLPEGVAGVLDGPRFPSSLTGQQALARLAALDGRVSECGVGSALDDVALADRAHERVGSYSLGMRQRLGLAAALLRRPRALVLDEPANGLDPAGAQVVTALLQRLRADGVAVLLSSHDLDAVEHLCDDVTVLLRGRVVHSGDLNTLRRNAAAPTSRLTTTDDEAALRLAHELAGAVSLAATGLEVQAPQPALDAWLLQLAAHGVAVRSLALESTSLRTAFLQLTGGDDEADDHRVNTGHVG